jgi:hypothetical protein
MPDLRAGLPAPARGDEVGLPGGLRAPRVTANVGGDPERVRYPVVRLMAWLSDEVARRLGYAE